MQSAADVEMLVCLRSASYLLKPRSCVSHLEVAISNGKGFNRHLRWPSEPVSLAPSVATVSCLARRSSEDLPNSTFDSTLLASLSLAMEPSRKRKRDVDAFLCPRCTQQCLRIATLGRHIHKCCPDLFSREVGTSDTVFGHSIFQLCCALTATDPHGRYFRFTRSAAALQEWTSCQETDSSTDDFLDKLSAKEEVLRQQAVRLQAPASLPTAVGPASCTLDDFFLAAGLNCLDLSTVLCSLLSSFMPLMLLESLYGKMCQQSLNS